MTMNKIVWLIAAALLTGCSIASYTRQNPDGSTVTVRGFEIGTDKALSGFSYDGDGKGAVSVDINSLDANQTKGMAQLNQFISLIVEGTAKGLVAGAKP